MCGMIARLVSSRPLIARGCSLGASLLSKSSAPGSRWRVRLTALLCASALCIAPIHAQNQLPALGDPAGEDFSLATEHKRGAEIMREIHIDPDYLDDPLLLEYLQSIWQPLVASSRARGNITAD